MKKDAPRKCPYEIIYEDRQTRSRKARLCNAPALGHGYCSEHGYVAILLEAAGDAGYPELWVNASLCIGEGRGSWEAYAVRCPAHRDTIIIKKLTAIRRQRQNSEISPSDDRQTVLMGINR